MRGEVVQKCLFLSTIRLKTVHAEGGGGSTNGKISSKKRTRPANNNNKIMIK